MTTLPLDGDNMKRPTAGILGGMGPYATLAFYRSMLEMTAASRDWEHPRVVLDVNTQIPSRTRHLLFGEASPVPEMITACQQLAAFPVDFIAVPCNSACYFLESVQPVVSCPILNIVELTAGAVARELGSGKKVAVLGGFVTWKTRSYEPFLAAVGLDYIHLPETVQRNVELSIEELKLSGSIHAAVARVGELVAFVSEHLNADGIILGCTEFALLSHNGGQIPTIDSSRVLAKEVLRRCNVTLRVD